MRTIIGLLAFFLVTACTAGVVYADEEKPVFYPVSVEFVISEPCSLIGFVDIISGAHHTSEWVKVWYHKKRTGAEIEAEDSKLCGQYRTLIDSSQLAFKDPTGRELDLHGHIIKIAATCKTLDEFYNKCKSEIPAAEVETIKSVLDHYLPVYEELVWKPNFEILQKHLEVCKAESARTKMNEHFSTVQRFFGSPWVKDTALLVVLTPLPSGGHTSSGTSYGTTQTVELHPEKKFDSFADVVFHEGVHALWFSIPNHQIGIDRKFVLKDGRMLPITELYEGIATALGQGWYNQKAFGVVQKEWYRDAAIDKYARAVYPLCVEYLDHGKPMDSAFFETSTRIYYKVFPKTNRTISMFPGFFLAGEKILNLETVRGEIHSSMPRLRELEISGELAAEKNIAEFKKMRTEYASFMVSPQNLNKLESYGVSPRQQKKILARKGKPIVLKVGDKEVLFCLGETPEVQQERLFEVFKGNKWPSVQR